MKTGDIEITAMALKQLALFNLNNECSKVDSRERAFNKHVNVHILGLFHSAGRPVASEANKNSFMGEFELKT